MSSSGDRNGAGEVGEMSEKVDTSGRVVPAAASATDRVNRPRLRLGDAEQIAQERMAFGGGASSSAGMSAEQFSGSNNSTEIANQLINALNGDDKGPQVGQPAAPAPRPHLSHNPVHTEPAPQAAPNNNSMMAPMPMSAPNAGMRPRMGGRPAVGMGRGPAQNGSSAPGLRLKAAAPGQGAVTPPICRAESLYELLNSSKTGVRPIRRTQVEMTPAQSPMPRPAQPVVTSANVVQPSYAQEAPSQGVDVQPGASVPHFGHETAGIETSDQMGGNPAPTNKVVVSGADAPVEQEVQDAINAILKSSMPQNGGVERPQGTEREEALRHVRMLRAQLVGLQQRLGDEPEQAQPTANYQAPHFAHPGQAEMGNGAQDPNNQPYSGGVAPHQAPHQMVADQQAHMHGMNSAGQAGFETGQMSPASEHYATTGHQQPQHSHETQQSASAFYVPAPAQDPVDVVTDDAAAHAQDHFQGGGAHNAYQGQGLMGRHVTGRDTGQNDFHNGAALEAQGFSNPDFAFAPQGGTQVPTGMPAPVAPRANAHYDATQAQSYVYEAPGMEQSSSHSAEPLPHGGNRVVVPYSSAASSQSNMLTHESAPQQIQPQQELSYAPEQGAHDYGQTHQFEDQYDQQAGQWSEQSPVVPAMGNEGLPTVIDGADLPRGIMPDVGDEHRGGGIGSGFKIAGGLALAASIAGAGIFYSGYPVPYKDEAVAQMRSLQSSVMAMIDSQKSSADDAVIVDQAAVQRPIALDKAGASGASVKAASLSALNVEGDTKEPIKLAVSMTDVVGEGNAVVRFKGVPAGATLSGGFMVSDGTWLVPQDKLAEAEMSVPEYYSGSFSVEAQALAEDAITVVSDQVSFDVNIGSSSVAASDTPSGDSSSAGFVTASDSDAVVSTLSETVPTASNEAIIRPAAASEEKQVAALAAVKPAEKPLDALGKLVADGNKLLDKADFAGARKLFKKAAEEGSSEAALAMGQSYDPVYFEKRKLSRSNADTEQALIWYQEALSRGNDAARTRVDDLLRWVQKGS